MVHGTRCTVDGVWHMAHGAVVHWCIGALVHGTRHMAHGTWCMVHGAWHMTHGTWHMVHGTWCMAHDAWCMAHGSRYMLHGMKSKTCNMLHGIWYENEGNAM